MEFFQRRGGERWAKYLGSDPALYASEVGGSVTNALFNWVAYRRLLNARKPHSEEEKIITKVKGEKIKWGESFVVAFFCAFTYLEGKFEGFAPRYDSLQFKRCSKFTS